MKQVLESVEEGNVSVINTKSLLPNHILIYIFKFLNIKDMGRVASVCGKWHRVAESDDIWKVLGKLLTVTAFNTMVESHCLVTYIHTRDNTVASTIIISLTISFKRHINIHLHVGLRRWECALQGFLGFSMTPTESFRRSSSNKSNREKKS